MPDPVGAIVMRVACQVVAGPPTTVRQPPGSARPAALAGGRKVIPDRHGRIHMAVVAGVEGAAPSTAGGVAFFSTKGGA
jgi:hypothetical protein